MERQAFAPVDWGCVVNYGQTHTDRLLYPCCQETGVVDSGQSVTVLLARWKTGDREALPELLPLVYNELHAIAHRYLRRERPGHTLQSTALVHEAYVRLAGQDSIAPENRAHFVAIAANVMRQILVDYARQRRAAKRGPGFRIEFDENLHSPEKNAIDVLELDSALDKLSQRDAQQGRIVELRFFGGLTVEETADALGISAATVKRDWVMAKAWLTRAMGRGNDGRDPAVAHG